jgi:tetratricopeptide (TPR) repeat protein
VHLERGGYPARAVPFLQRAAAVAARISANEEAIRCLSSALALVARQPEGRERDELELELRAALSVSLNSSRGYADPDVEANLARVFVLSRPGGDHDVPVRWLWAAFTMRFMLGDLAGTLEVAERALAQSIGDPSCRCEAHHAMGGTLSSLGRLEASRQHFEAALAAYDETHPQRSALGSDLGVFAHAWYSHTLWLLGDDPAAVAHADAAITLARKVEHPYSETLALAYAALLHQLRLETIAMRECAEAVVSRCDRYGFAYYGDWARVLLGWSHGQASPAEGAVQIESALARLDARRAQGRRPYYMSLLADVYRRGGHRERAAAILDHAIATAIARSDNWWLPALYFQKSELAPSSSRDLLVRRGLELARSQNNRGVERQIQAAS